MKNGLISLMLIYISINCFSQQISNSVLWEISGNGLKEPSYLFGTIHLVPERQFALNDSVIKCFNNSKGLMLEINPDIHFRGQKKLAKGMFLPKGKTIKDYIDSSLFILLHEYLKDSLRLDEKKLNRYYSLKPGYFSSAILHESFGRTRSYETEFKKKAGKMKNFEPFETFDESMKLLDSIPFELQYSIGPDNYKIDREYFKLLDLYQKQNMRRLDSLTFYGRSFNKLTDIMLTNRNIKWVPKLEKSIGNESTFIAVGCAHLIGENGLINLLVKSGYTMRPIIFDNLNRTALPSGSIIVREEGKYQTYQQNGRYFTHKQLSTILKANPGSVKEYNKSEALSKTGVVFLLTGVVSSGTGIVYSGLSLIAHMAGNNDNASRYFSNSKITLLSGLGLMTVGFAFGGSSVHHLKKSINNYNDSLKTVRVENSQVFFGMTGSGIGIRLKF
jgi:uncharacterized protein